MARLLYPSLQQPTQIGSGPPPAPPLSQREFSQPVYDLRGNIGNRLDHSIVFPWGAPRVETTEDRWHQPWSLHPGFKPGLLTAAQRADWFGRAAPFPEFIYVPALWPRLNEPVRLLSDRYLSVSNQKALFFTPSQFGETPYVPAWWPRLNEPVWELKNKYLSTVNQQAFFFTQIQFGEVIFVSSSWPRFNEPVRLPKGLNKELQMALMAVETNVALPNPNLRLYRTNQIGTLSTLWGGRNG